MRTQSERTAAARRILLAAARSLIASKGMDAFSLAEVGELASVSRGLSGYHFRSRDALVQEAFEAILGSSWPDGELGLSPLVAWMNDQVRLAAEGDRDVLVLLQLAVGGGGAGAIPQLRRRYWDERLQHVQAHLRRAQVLNQVSDDQDAAAVAPLVMSLLHGEMNRVVATGATPSPLLEEFTLAML